MIRKASERVHTSKKMFGAPGELEAFQILNPGEFNDKGRLFNHCVLRPGEGLGMHRHSGDFEIYTTSSKDRAFTTITAPKPPFPPATPPSAWTAKSTVSSITARKTSSSSP